MNKNLLLAAGVFLAIVIAGAAFLTKPKVTTIPTLLALPAASEVSGEAREITISGNEYSFNPASISVAKGEKISLTFTNVGSQFHNFVINGLDVKTKTIGTGKSDTVEFTTEEAGNFTFFCGIGDHQNLGMEGELKVE